MLTLFDLISFYDICQLAKDIVKNFISLRELIKIISSLTSTAKICEDEIVITLLKESVSSTTIAEGNLLAVLQYLGILMLLYEYHSNGKNIGCFTIGWNADSLNVQEVFRRFHHYNTILKILRTYWFLGLPASIAKYILNQLQYQEILSKVFAEIDDKYLILFEPRSLESVLKATNALPRQ